MTHGRYIVTGRREYRGHKPGDIFEARIDRKAEARARARGDIKLLGHVTPVIPPDSYTLPDGWHPPAEQARTSTRDATVRSAK